MSAKLSGTEILRRTILLWLVFSFIVPMMNGQTIWKNTVSAPGKPATGIVLVGDSCLVLGFTTGIMRSMDHGASYTTTLEAPAIFTVSATADERILAGGPGKVYSSDDLGLTWDSTSVNSIYPVTQIIQDHSGGLFAITGMLSIELGYVGDGVLYSGDGGITWEQRNDGLGIYRCAERIAIDRNGRLYLAMADEYVTGNGGLFVSDNNGLSWEHISITIDGQGVVPDLVKIGNTYGLSVSPDDSLVFSFAGTAINALVTLNARKSIEDILDNSHWKAYDVFEGVSWWLDRPLFNIHFAKNGEWFSSTRGTENSGGTYYSQNKGKDWVFVNQGIGLGQNGLRNVQYFAETSKGKIFMVQQLDEQLYYTERGPLSIISNETTEEKVSIVPNPVKKAGTVCLYLSGTNYPKRISIFDTLGNRVYSIKVNDSYLEFPSPDKPGLYFIRIQYKHTEIVHKLIVSL